METATYSSSLPSPGGRKRMESRCPEARVYATVCRIPLGQTWRPAPGHLSLLAFSHD
ncbi:hypothetical protein [Spirosoma utsteinense]|uniref:Uncharacterized protein n=1 Tax=Spirosoma utsteinense TaxID=2585773 RepID=A0ABR6W220_9BACT|nr:hypothetical protein [Spirosoma utsteinense]MBC3785165.1 hypothetical protein [Spirosoma utsteinense]MBC3790610.1 hypothetical protein [Spirosoma utsteinense]